MSHEGDGDSISLPGTEEMSEVKSAQRNDPERLPMCEYLESNVLHTEEKLAKRIVLVSERFVLIQGVLYYESSNHVGRLCIVVPKDRRATLLQESQC